MPFLAGEIVGLIGLAISRLLHEDPLVGTAPLFVTWAVNETGDRFVPALHLGEVAAIQSAGDVFSWAYPDASNNTAAAVAQGDRDWWTWHSIAIRA